MRKPTVKNRLYLCLLCLATTLLAAKQFVSVGYYSVLHDDTVTYVGWARQFLQGLREGVWYPRWMPDECRGYGCPTFLLYPPLSFYAAAAFAELTGSLLLGMNMVRWLALYLTSLGIYFLLREHLTPRSAFLAALCYLLFPFTVLQQYLCGSFAATVSTVWFAPILVHLLRYHRNRHWAAVIWAGLCYGGLLLTHLINAYMFSFVMGGLLVCLATGGRRVATLWALPLVMAIGALVSAAYLLPLVCERGDLQLASFVTQGAGFDYRYFFLFPSRVHLIPPSVFWPRFYRLYLVHELLLLGLLGYALLRLVRVGRTPGDFQNTGAPLCRLFAVLALLTLYPTIGASQWMWRLVPFFNYIQFPYRWLQLSVFLCTPVAGWLWAVQERACPARTFRASVAMTMVAMATVAVCWIQQAHGLTGKELAAQAGPSPPEHLPVGVEAGSLQRAARTAVVEGRGTAAVLRWQTTRRLVAVMAGENLTIRLGTLHFPGWRAYLDGNPLTLKAEAGSGAMLARVPSGSHRLELEFVDTGPRLLGKALSLASLTLLAGWLVALRRTGRSTACPSLPGDGAG
ncbi:MAG TPA: 6-pyruvoyl-tetrahydropterin synthase-related protein [Geomonas sp.]|nr:6-pyruvoyl-tetrahydropterin synthase-related protein [Geomonas sp.]